MDGQRFDDLMKALVARASRRGVLKGAAVGAAGLLALLGGRDAGAEAGGGRGRRGCVATCKQRFRPGRPQERCICACGRGDGSSTPCGTVTCPPGEVCCNRSCGICTEPGGFCIQIFCDEPRPTRSGRPARV